MNKGELTNDCVIITANLNMNGEIGFFLNLLNLRTIYCFNADFEGAIKRGN